MDAMGRIADIRAIKYPNEVTEDTINTLNEHLDAIVREIEEKDKRIAKFEIWLKEKNIKIAKLEKVVKLIAGQNSFEPEQYIDDMTKQAQKIIAGERKVKDETGKS